jgi:hypothetical protein
MFRSLKAIGLVIAAVAAFSAVAASAASAAEFHSEATTTAISGEQTTTHVFKTDPGEVTCTKATFSGTQSTKTSPSQTITPKYEGCHIIVAGFTISMTVDFATNECDYEFTATGEVHIKCNKNQETGVIVSGSGCKVTVPAQTVNSVEYVNTNAGSSRDIDVVAKGAGIRYSYSGFTCGSGTNTTNGTYTGTTTVKGSSGGKQVGIWWE